MWATYRRGHYCSDRSCGAEDCATCRGSGEYNVWEGEEEGPPCVWCGGTGVVYGDEGAEECVECGGRGWVDPDSIDSEEDWL